MNGKKTFEFKTSVGSPFALVRSGNGCKMVFLTSKTYLGVYKAHAFKAHWRKVMSGKHEVYPSSREVLEQDIVKQWVKWPTMSGVKKAVERANQSV